MAVSTKIISFVKKIIKLLFIITAIAFLLINVLKGWSTVKQYLQNLELLPLVISFLIMLFIYPEGALNYHVLLKSLHVKTSLRKSFYIFIIANTGRYIPGSIWQYLGRIELAKKIIKLDRRLSLIILFIEIILLLTAGSLIAFFIPFFININNLYFGYLLFLLPFSVFFLHPFLFNKLIRFINLLFKKNIDISNFKMDFSKIISVLPFFILNFLLNGLSLFFLIGSLTHDYAVWKILAFSSFFALSWILGYITLIAPAGFGVTEASLALLLGSIMPFPLASSVAISYRFFLVISELITFLVVLKLGYENN